MSDSPASLQDLDPEWVTLRAQTDAGLPIVILVDRAAAVGAPWPEAPLQVGVAVPLAVTSDGLPDPSEHATLRAFEQRLVDAAVGEARLVAVMTLEGIREWILYARTSDWSTPFAEQGVSVVVTDDPAWNGLRELTGESLEP